MPNKSCKFIFSHYVWLKPTCHIHKGGLILVSEGSRELTIDLSCVPTSKVSVPHFARLAVFIDRFLWDYNGKPLFKDRHRRNMNQ